jgi:[calcium/calmodulin-dependent protein kinase] kinase
VKAVNKFKALIGKDKSRAITSILGEHGDAHFSQPPTNMPKEGASLPSKSHSFNAFGQQHLGESPIIDKMSEDVKNLKVRPIPTLSIDDTTKAEELNEVGSGKVFLSHTSTATDEAMSRMETIAEIEQLDPDKLPPFRSFKPHSYTTDEAGHKGHAHDPLEDKLYLYIGPSTFSGTSSTRDDDSTFVSGGDDVPIVSESPGAADVDIYETAYRDEIERIMARAKEEQKEPNVYLTRRVDARLVAISGLAGKWAAKGEEAKNQLKDYTQFSARKARVTEVSRALRQAAREEYERRRQEHREWIAAEKAERARAKEEEASKPTTSVSTPTPAAGSDVEEPPTGSPQSPSRHSSMWKGKAVDAGRQARSSLMGLVDMVKSKSRTRSKDEES